MWQKNVPYYSEHTNYDDFKAINRIVPIETMAGRRGGFRILNVLARCDDDC